MVVPLVPRHLNPLDLAVLVVEEDQANGDGSKGEEEEGNEVHGDSLGVFVDAGHALGGADGDVDTSAEGEEVAEGVGVDVALRDEHATEDDGDAGEEVEGKSLEGGEAADGGEDEVVGDLLGELVDDGGGGDSPAEGRVAQEEGAGDEGAVGEVVEEVTDEDARHDTALLDKLSSHLLDNGPDDLLGKDGNDPGEHHAGEDGRSPLPGLSLNTLAVGVVLSVLDRHVEGLGQDEEEGAGENGASGEGGGVGQHGGVKLGSAGLVGVRGLNAHGLRGGTTVDDLHVGVGGLNNGSRGSGLVLDHDELVDGGDGEDDADESHEEDDKAARISLPSCALLRCCANGVGVEKQHIVDGGGLGASNSLVVLGGPDLELLR
mmetsp:Transcript_25238/g.52421  ORF Transcript_25238/g.52421 Transcript_25238/m.52421 type:complete len:375 (+) Transcript_25238:99-1223(+)